MKKKSHGKGKGKSPILTFEKQKQNKKHGKLPGKNPILTSQKQTNKQTNKHETWYRQKVGESWGMANDGEWRTVQYLVEGVKAIK